MKKSRYLERRLSASQRDTFLIKEAKEDRLEKKQLREMLKTSNDTLTSTLNNMSEAMLNMINAVIKATENLSQPIQARNQKFCRTGEVSWRNRGTSINILT